MATLKRTTLVETTERHRAELNRRDLLTLLKAGNIDVPDNADIYIRVPGGGDWSNTDLDVDNDTPLIVQWTTKKTEGNLNG